MKKTIKKLNLEKQTIRTLTGDDLSVVNGGVSQDATCVRCPETQAPSCGIICQSQNPTCTC